MTITIYDYDNSPKIITIPEDKEIESIFVEIISAMRQGGLNSQMELILISMQVIVE